MNDNYIGHIIKETRLKKQISSSKLCAGLCSPSMLTRIESGERYPSKLLFDALMERMGESGKNYNFIGSPREAELHRLLDLIITYYSHRNYEQLFIYIEQYRKIMNPKDKLELQILFLFESLYAKYNNLPFYNKIIDGINLTINHFDYSKIPYYLLSNFERLLFNALGVYYVSSKEEDIAISIFKNLQFLCNQHNDVDYNMLHTISIIRYNEIICHLHKHNFSEICYLCSKMIPQTLYNHQEIVLGRLYYQNCYAHLALDKDCINEDILLAYYTFLDIENDSYPDFLKKDINTDYGLTFEVSFY